MEKNIKKKDTNYKNNQLKLTKKIAISMSLKSADDLEKISAYQGINKSNVMILALNDYKKKILGSED